MLPAPLATLCPRSTQKSFFSTDIEPDTLFRLIHANTGNWKIEKLILRHKDCPQSVHIAYMKDHRWFVRLTAGLNKHMRAEYARLLFSDPKSTVRAAAYKTVLDMEPENAQEICQKIVNDTQVHGYFYSNWSIGYMRAIADGSMTLANWDAAIREEYEKMRADYDAYKLEIQE